MSRPGTSWLGMACNLVWYKIYTAKSVAVSQACHRHTITTLQVYIPQELSQNHIALYDFEDFKISRSFIRIF